jgi:translation initiation factor 1
MSIFAGTELYKPPSCETCGKIETDCVCEPQEPPPALATAPEKQTARLQIEKRKRGKKVTVVRGLAEGHPEPHFSQLLTKVKNHCGAGGAIKDDAIEIQGDQLERLSAFLRQLGFKVK